MRRAGRSLMGHKSNPIGLRLQINRTWDSRSFAEGQDYGRLLLEDLKIRQYIVKTLPQAAISKVVIERPAKLCRISIYAARPGVIIGKKGSDVEKAAQEARLDDLVGRVAEHRRDPQARGRRQARRAGHRRPARRCIAFRRAMKRAVQSAMRLGADGIKVYCGGRLGGAEIARSESYREGRVPLHTLRANIDYAEAEAHTAYGVCGVKVWVFKGEILGHDPLATDRLMMEAQTSGVRPARDDRR
ncbi:30S ribosomal protein S3 [Sphingomonas sp. MMS24-JH45]